MVNKTGPQIQPTSPVIKPKSGQAGRKVQGNTAGNISFHQLLDQAQQTKQEVVFSAHARERIESRNIEFDAEDMSRIEDAMDKVKAKGARSSLLLFGEVALLASVTNRTIITAVDGADDREQIFTGIDSAVILR
jgi:flagellar operon protein